MFKVVDQIWLNSEITSVVHKQNSFTIITKEGKIEFSFIKGVLILNTNYMGDIMFQLDMREIYDFDDKGRVYNLYKELGKVVVEYTKYWNNVLDNINFKKYLTINTKFEIDKIMEWKKVHFVEDEERKSPPYDLFVYDAFKIKCKGKDKIIIGFDNDKKNALKIVSKNYKETKEKLTCLNAPNNIDIAYLNSQNSLLDLYVNFDDLEGLYAGLPWFFQFWTRDEAISLKALIDMKKYDLCKQIILRRIKIINNDGRIPNRFPHSDLATADGTGWMFKRLYDLLKKIKKDEPFEEYFSSKNLNNIREDLRKSISITINSTENLLVRNKGLETWMDTSYQNDNREGFRIEIQALWMRTLKLSNYIDQLLGEKPKYDELLERTKQKVKNTFFNGSILKDGLNDSTIRPNIFLTYYIYKYFLTNKEWERIFDKSIDKLWLDWGGLSTIDINSELFFNQYTGENNKSYHRGDSWFFINNIAAWSLSELNSSKYKKYITKIVDASTNDNLFHGIIGRSSEVSSANELKAQGSLFQLWSSATYIELIDKLKEINFL
jgi:predicted glycogen debranching enzyme